MSIQHYGDATPVQHVMNFINEIKADSQQPNPAGARGRIARCFCLMREAYSLVWSVLVSLFRSRVSLEAEILILRHQLNIQRRHVPKRVALSAVDRLIFVGLYRLVPNAIKALTIVKPIPSSVGVVPVSDRIGAGNPGAAAADRLYCWKFAG